MRLRKPFRIKHIDMSYCMQCRWSLFASHCLYDYCRYDGMACEQNEEDDFVFTCKHFEPIPHHVLDRILISL
jgi:hypothetical protein